ncbi:OmpA family protein [Planctobacterium marinum]|uniref:OmpA-like domain-containing protein n=1 Tax=Planctobacterium marinum TaxID=1631968 RepID=A0AA48KRR4_9ALTE|nr:hypothetical protein MACH26_19130 [Planctobacterium marinum]
MTILKTLAFSILLSAFTFTVFGQNFKSISEIEKQLDPLAVIANHDGIRRSIDLNIPFELNSAQIMATAKPQLKALSTALKGKLAQCNIALVGHTDASGDAAHNQDLSDKRAKSVLTALLGEFDVNPHMLSAKGVGETQLIAGIAPNDKRHRRVEVSLVDPEACKKTLSSNKSMQKSASNERKIDW